MTADVKNRQSAADAPSPGHAAAKGASRADLLDAVRRAEADAARKREAAERKAGEIRAEGLRAATRVADGAGVEGRALVKRALAEATAEMGETRKERLAKVKAESDAMTAAARLRYAELGNTFLKDLDGVKDA